MSNYYYNIIIIILKDCMFCQPTFKKLHNHLSQVMMLHHHIEDSAQYKLQYSERIFSKGSTATQHAEEVLLWPSEDRAELARVSKHNSCHDAKLLPCMGAFKET